MRNLTRKKNTPPRPEGGGGAPASARSTGPDNECSGCGAARHLGQVTSLLQRSTVHYSSWADERCFAGIHREQHDVRPGALPLGEETVCFLCSWKHCARQKTRCKQGGILRILAGSIGGHMSMLQPVRGNHSGLGRQCRKLRDLMQESVR